MDFRCESSMNNTACLPLHCLQGCPLRRWPRHKAASLEWPGQRDKPTAKPLPPPQLAVQVTMVISCRPPAPSSSRPYHSQWAAGADKGLQAGAAVTQPAATHSIDPRLCPCPQRTGRLGEEGALSIFSSCPGTSRRTASKETDFQPSMGGLASLN